jgi:hypothetical protein
VKTGRMLPVSHVKSGVFISNADGSLLMATHPIIASEFDALRDSTWLLTSFSLAGAAMQPLVSTVENLAVQYDRHQSVREVE